MREAPRFQNSSIERHAREILERLQENFRDSLDVRRRVIEDGEAEFAIEADGIENLTLVVAKNTVTIKDIRSRNVDEGYGKRMVQALIETTDEAGCALFAENVMPEYDQWWRAQGFIPLHRHAADYVYRGQRAA